MYGRARRGHGQELVSVHSDRLGQACSSTAAAALSRCVFDQVAGAPLPTSVDVVVDGDGASGRTLRWIRFHLRHHGIDVAGSDGYLGARAGIVGSYSGSAHLALDGIAAAPSTPPLTAAAARRLALQRGLTDYRRFFDPEAGRFKLLGPSPADSGVLLVVDERSGAVRRRPSPHLHDLVDRTIDTGDCTNQPMVCAATGFSPQTLLDRLAGSGIGQCRYQGGSYGGQPGDLDFEVLEKNYVKISGFGYVQTGEVWRDQSCAGSAGTTVLMGSDGQAFAHTWLNHIRDYAVRSEFSEKIGQHGLPTMEVQLKNLPRDVICLTNASGCVINDWGGPFRMELRKYAMEPGDPYTGAPSVGLLAHEFGHVISHSAGVLNVVNNALNQDVQAGTEGFADAFRLSYLLHRYECGANTVAAPFDTECPFTWDSLALTRTDQIGSRIHSARADDTLHGVSYPVPSYDRPQLGQVDRAAFGYLDCNRLGSYDCGAVLGRAFWFAWWNAMPAASRRSGTEAGDPILSSGSPNEIREIARRALVATLQGDQAIWGQLNVFRSTLFDLSDSADHTRLEELFRLLCVGDDGHPLPACHPNLRYPGIHLPVGSVAERSFADGPVQGWSAVSRSASSQLRGYSSTQVNQEEFIPGSEMTPIGSASLQVLAQDRGIDLVGLKLPQGGTGKFTVTVPPVSLVDPTARALYPVDLLTWSNGCDATVTLTFQKPGGGIEDMVTAWHPVNTRVNCRYGSRIGTGVFIGPDGQNLMADLRPGTYEVTVSRGGSMGNPIVFGVVLRTSCPGPDSDGNGVNDACDPGFCAAGDQDGDQDGDRVCDDVDNCVCPAGSSCNITGLEYNPLQEDRDGDGLGDRCDPCIADDRHVNPSDGIDDDDASFWLDDDDDGICSLFDNCAGTPNRDQADRDGDNLGDACDVDPDGDGLVGGADSCPNDEAPTYGTAHGDSDGDGIGDECDCFDQSQGAVAPAGFRNFSDCGELRRDAKYVAAQEAVVAFARAMAFGGIESLFSGSWEQLEGCLDFPCDLTADPILAALAEEEAYETIDYGYATEPQLASFVHETAQTDLERYEAENLVRWLLETGGSELVRP